VSAAPVVAQLARLATGGTPDPSEVKPGWVALVVVLVLCAATVLLWLSMRKQLGKIRFEEKEIPGRRRGRTTSTGRDDQPTQL
jgi:hypothetical protein